MKRSKKANAAYIIGALVLAIILGVAYGMLTH